MPWVSILARVDGVIGDTTAKIYFYHTDYQGSVRVITDQGGTVVFNADYYAFGTKYISNGDFDEEHGFTGKEWDPDVGLYYYDARWYDPELGRFISEDPAGDPNSPNLYSYGRNNPLSYIDSDGHFVFLIALLDVLLSGVIVALRTLRRVEVSLAGFVKGQLPVLLLEESMQALVRWVW